MILESAQLLCTAHHILDNVSDDSFYKATHKNHPCAVWVRKTHTNYEFLYDLFMAYCREYSYRYNKIHLCETKFRKLLKQIPKNIHQGPLTPFALAMPDEFKCDDPVKSYRAYYNANKRHLFGWKDRPVPFWIKL